MNVNQKLLFMTFDINTHQTLQWSEMKFDASHTVKWLLFTHLKGNLKLLQGKSHYLNTRLKWSLKCSCDFVSILFIYWNVILIMAQSNNGLFTVCQWQTACDTMNALLCWLGDAVERRNCYLLILGPKRPLVKPLMQRKHDSPVPSRKIFCLFITGGK